MSRAISDGLESMGWDGIVITGQWFSLSTFGANKDVQIQHLKFGPSDRAMNSPNQMAPSQIVMKEIPKKSPRHPPISATMLEEG